MIDPKKRAEDHHATKCVRKDFHKMDESPQVARDVLDPHPLRDLQIPWQGDHRGDQRDCCDKNRADKRASFAFA
jgi:hypothetical protein